MHFAYVNYKHYKHMRKAYTFVICKNRVDGISPIGYIEIGVTVSILSGRR